MGKLINLARLKQSFWEEESCFSKILLPFASKEQAAIFFENCLLLNHSNNVVVDIQPNEGSVCVKTHGAKKEDRYEAQQDIMELYSLGD